MRTRNELIDLVINQKEIKNHSLYETIYHLFFNKIINGNEYNYFIELIRYNHYHFIIKNNGEGLDIIKFLKSLKTKSTMKDKIIIFIIEKTISIGISFIRTLIKKRKIIKNQKNQ